MIYWTKTKQTNLWLNEVVVFTEYFIGNFHITLRREDLCFHASLALGYKGIFAFKLPVTVRAKISAWWRVCFLLVKVITWRWFFYFFFISRKSTIWTWGAYRFRSRLKHRFSLTGKRFLVLSSTKSIVSRKHLQLSKCWRKVMGKVLQPTTWSKNCIPERFSK